MGLLDFNNPELIQGLMMLTAKKGQTPGLLQNFLQMQEQRKQRELQEQSVKQSQEMRAMQMQQMQRQQEAEARRQAAFGRLAEQNPQLAPLFEVAPEQAVQRAFPEPVKPKMGFAPNGQAVDMNALTPGANFAKQPDWKDPEYQAFQLKRAQAGASRVSVDNRQENEFNKKIGAQFADNYNDILKGGQVAQGKYRDLQRFSSIIDKVPTGKLEPLKAEVGRLAASLGIKVDTETLGFQESLDAMSKQFALTLRNPGSGAGMPGALSDKDREFLEAMVPGLSKTPGGNRLIIEAFKRVAQRDMEVSKLAREYKARTGKFDEGFYEVLAQKFGGADLLGDLYETAAQRGASGAVSGARVYDPATGTFK